MRTYWELSKISFQRQLTYRAALIAGLLTNFFFGILRAAVLTALYDARSQVAGVSLQQAVTYTGLTQSLIAFLSLFMWADLLNSVYSGQISADLLKPMGYFRAWMARDFGQAAANLLFRGLPLIIGYFLFFDIAIPGFPYGWLALLASLVLAWLVSFSWRFLVNLVAFWEPNALGTIRLFFIISWFASGFFMPLRFFPEWAQRLCYLTPFPHWINTVVEIYLGLLTPPEIVQALLSQLAWGIFLVVLGQLVLRSGIRRLVILGG
jgi:ABC-2 type transport system permease protein